MAVYHGAKKPKKKTNSLQSSEDQQSLADLRKAFMRILDEELGHVTRGARIDLCDRVIARVPEVLQKPLTQGDPS